MKWKYIDWFSNQKNTCKFPLWFTEAFTAYTDSWKCLFWILDNTISAWGIIKKFKKTMSNKDTNYTEIKWIKNLKQAPQEFRNVLKKTIYFNPCQESKAWNSQFWLPVFHHSDHLVILTNYFLQFYLVYFLIHVPN